MTPRDSGPDEQLRHLVDALTDDLAPDQREQMWQRIADRHAFDGVDAALEAAGAGRHRSRRRAGLVAAAVLVSCALLGGIAVAGDPVPEQHDVAAAASGEGSERVTERELAQLHDVARRSRMPLDSESAARVLADDTQVGRVVFLPARSGGGGCFLMSIARHRDGECVRAESTTSGLLVYERAGVKPSGKRIFAVYGIAADDVDRVFLRFADGTTTSVYRASNAFHASGEYVSGNPPVDLVVNRHGHEVTRPIGAGHASRIAGSNR